MSKIILSTILAFGFIVCGLNAYADKDNSETTNADTEMTEDTAVVVYSNYSGKVTAIDGDTVTIEDADGNSHKVNVTGFQDLQELQVESLEKGDKVMVLQRDAKPYAISKMSDSWDIIPDVDLPDLADTDTVKGKVTEVDGDTIKFKSKDGSMHSVKITAMQNTEELQAETVEVGDIVIVNVRDGKPYAVSKHLEAWSVSE